MFAMLALAMMVLLLYLTDKSPRDGTAANSMVATLASRPPTWLPVALELLMVLLIVWWSTHGEPVLPTVLANVAFVVFGLWLVGQGLDHDHGRTFASGVICLLTWTVMRYMIYLATWAGCWGQRPSFSSVAWHCSESPGFGGIGKR